MSHHVRLVHTDDDDPKWSMPYTPAIEVSAGRVVFFAGVTAAPVYHSHPHRDEEFEEIPDDPGEQAEMAMENLLEVLAAAGGELEDVVSFTKYIVDVERSQDAINAVVSRYLGDHRPTSTAVEVVRLAPHPGLLLELTAIAAIAD